MTHHQQSIAFIFKSPLNNLNSYTLETKLQSVLLFMTKLRCFKNPNVWQAMITSHQRVLACGAKTVDKYCFSVSATYREHKNCLLTCHFLLQGEVMQRVTGNFWTIITIIGFHKIVVLCQVSNQSYDLCITSDAK